MRQVGRTGAIVAFALLLTAGGILVACDGDERGPGAVLQDFLDGWRDGDLGNVALISARGDPLTPAQVLAEIDTLAGDLDARRVNARPTAQPRVAGSRADATVSVEWSIAEGLVWPYQTDIALRDVDGDGAWRVVFEPYVVHPALVPGDHLVVARLAAPRGSILGGQDVPLVGPQAPATGFAQALLGTVGEVTPAQLAAEPGHYLRGQRVGQSGLQQLYDGVLGGRPGAVVSVAGAPDALYRADATAGEALHTTLDEHVQAAAHAAFAAFAGQAGVPALVAVRISDGAIVAVANGGDQNLAFTANVPPGPELAALTAIGAAAGFGTTWRLGVPVDTSATPVALAVATAAVARGSWRAPRLFPSLPPGAPPAQPGPAGDPPDDGAALPEAAISTLHATMRDGAVAAGLTVGTAHALAGASGTGTWVTGWQGDYAFAVLVQGGAGAVAITDAFLRGIG